MGVLPPPLPPALPNCYNPPMTTTSEQPTTPTHGQPDQLVTRRDLDNAVNQLRTEFAALRHDTKEELREMRQEIRAHRQETTTALQRLDDKIDRQSERIDRQIQLINKATNRAITISVTIMTAVMTIIGVLIVLAQFLAA